MAPDNTITDLMLPDNDRGRVAMVFIKSGLFSVKKRNDEAVPEDVQLARAFVKIQAGYEHGFQPFYSMQNFNIIQGKVTMSAEAIGSKIKSHKRYDYKTIEHDDQHCKIQFIKDGKHDYVSTFTIADAKRAGLYKADSGWAKYPRAMLFARALTQGGRIVCPEAIKGAITEDEAANEIIDGETGEIIDVNAVDIIGPPTPEIIKTEVKEKGKTDKTKAAVKESSKTEKGKTATADQTAEAQSSGHDNRVGHNTELEASSDDKTQEKGLFDEEETKEETETKAGGYPSDLPFDPDTIKDVSRLYKMIHDHCGINPTEAWRILGIANTPELFGKYSTLADAFIKVWDHYLINKAKTE